MEIWGTLGPSCCEIETLKKMKEKGVTGMRLNLSHSSLEQSKEWISHLHQAGIKDLLIDMQGPELRLGYIKEREVSKGERVDISELRIPSIVEDSLEEGDVLLVDDAKIELKVKNNQFIVTRAGRLSAHKSIKIVDKEIKVPVLTKQDIENISLASQYGVTTIMQPFVCSGEDLREVKKQIKDLNVKLFAKIENREGIKNLESIIPEADTIVIARGDLGNDMPLWELPRAQKEIEEVCRQFNKPFLVVTQMLTSMIHSPLPTRAEVSDIFNAVLEGAEALMVTNETAIGEYPVEVIDYLSHTVKEAQDYRKTTFL